MKVLFLDDRQKRIDVAEERFKDDDLAIARTAEEAIFLIGKSWYGVIYLDHDLNGEEFVDSSRKDCGMEVVRHLLEVAGGHAMKMARPTIIVHSSNLHAALEMYTKLEACGYHVYYERFRYE